MKKTKLTLLSILFALTAFGQQEKGDLAIQFSGNYISQKIEAAGFSLNVSSGNIYLKIGKFVSQKLELGVKPNLSFQPGRSGLETAGVDVSFGFGSYATYSFLTEGAKAFPYLGAEVNFSPAGKDADGNSQMTINLGPYAGLKYFLNEKVNLDVGFNYMANVANNFDAGADLKIGGLFTFNVGIGVILGKVN